jgi:hypothetical protein
VKHEVHSNVAEESTFHAQQVRLPAFGQRDLVRSIGVTLRYKNITVLVQRDWLWGFIDILPHWWNTCKYASMHYHINCCRMMHVV